MPTDLELAFDALVNKQNDYNTLFNYAESNQPLVYSAKRLQDVFKDISARFTQNWCSVVIATSLDRLIFKGWNAGADQSNKTIEELYLNLQLGLEIFAAIRAALITGEGFLIVWPNQENLTEAYYNDPRLCHVFYKAENPKEKRFAAKWYQDASKKFHIILYYPDHLEYYITSKAHENTLPSNVNAFTSDSPDKGDNEYDTIPVFHFRLNQYVKSQGGEIINIVTLQDAINKLLADMMVAAEYGAFKQRWIITNAETKNLKNVPGWIWTLPPAETGEQPVQVGEFTSADLQKYFDAMNALANSIAIISRTPKYYFFNVGAVPSGEALLAMEAPLVKKIKQHQANFAPTLQELGAFLFKLNGTTEIKKSDLTPIWEPAESTQPLTEAQTFKTYIEAGVPMITAARWLQFSEDEINQMQDDIKAAQKEGSNYARALLEEARKNQEQSNETPTSEQE